MARDLESVYLISDLDIDKIAGLKIVLGHEAA